MREADMKCKGAVCLLPTNSRDTPIKTASLLHFPAIAAELARSRKDTAENAICCEFNYLCFRKEKQAA
jgi:hypothetical protein